MAAELDIVIAGEPMRLYADRALYWPARQRLLIADFAPHAVGDTRRIVHHPPDIVEQPAAGLGHGRLRQFTFGAPI